MSRDEIFRMVDECDVSDPDNVLNKSDECIPQGDASQGENNLEANSDDSSIASEDFDGDSNEFIAKSN